MTIKERDILERILDKLDEMSVRSERLERGMYGDMENGVRGLIQRQEDDERTSTDLIERINKIEYNNKLAWRGVSGLIGSGGLFYYLWDKFTS